MSAGGDAFDALYRAHAPSVFRRARRLLGADSDARDVVSEVCLSLFERPTQYAGASALSTFLYSMTTHACLNRIRSHKRRSQPSARERAAAVLGTAPPAPDSLLELRRLLEALPHSLAQVAVYYYLDELSQREIAEIMGCSRRHVGDLLVRLRATIAEEKSA